MISKIPATALGGVLLSGGGYFGMYVSDEVNLTLYDIMRKEGYDFIKDIQNSTDTQWQKEFEFYQSELKSENPTTNVSSWSDYKSMCDSRLNIKRRSASESDYLFLLRFCILRSIESHIQKKDENKSKKYLTYHTPLKEWHDVYDAKKSQISQITTTTVNDQNKNKIVKEIKVWCYENSKKKYLASEADSEGYKKVTDWCLKTEKKKSS